MNEDNPMRNILRGEYLEQAARSKRDRMAWEAYLKIITSAHFEGCSDEKCAELSYRTADAFLAERDKQRGGK